MVLCSAELLITMTDGTIFRSPFELFDEAEEARNYIESWKLGKTFRFMRVLRIFAPMPGYEHQIEAVSIESCNKWSW